MKISQSGQDVASKKQAGEQPTAGNGEKVSVIGCTNGLHGYVFMMMMMMLAS